MHSQNDTDFNPVEFDGVTASCNQNLQIQQDWAQKLDDFLAFNERQVLPNAGRVSKKAAEERARQECEQFELRRREHKESLGEAESIEVLEETAKQLEQGKKELGDEM